MISTGSAVHVLVDSTNRQRVADPRCVGSKTVQWIASLAIFGLLFALPVSAKGPERGAAVEVSLSSLPSEAKRTHQLVLSGGPFPYEKDGSVFGNRERQLPAMARGYYREYTVKTPGSRDRGARRIVCGGKPPTQPESCFYTADHYASFRRIAP